MPDKNLFLLTCHHVLPNEEAIKTATFTFGFVNEKSQGNTVTSEKLLDTQHFWTSEVYIQQQVDK